MGEAHPINAENYLNFKLSGVQECPMPITAVNRIEGLLPSYYSTEDRSFKLPQELVSQCWKTGSVLANQ